MTGLITPHHCQSKQHEEAHNSSNIKLDRTLFTTMVRWNKSDDAKLIELWRTPRNGIDPEKLDIETVKAVHKSHFPSRDYNNFAPLYRNKARAFCTARDKDGHRLSKFFQTE
jgi:hypothetical protein